ncbi:hypothetical protein D9757_000685 [Collybiopsis confluens]|uniref:peptidylprolyl isomerase n=1 Tax=Collybiopsis confluens TaxID=2823264 RepID=A0A8H5I1V1_9AGAR|nr:hypothetical protein D9757_000685 [Collybiopsis confluens]
MFTAVGGETLEYFPPNDVKITNVALSDVLADEKGRTTLKLFVPLLEPPSDDEEDDVDEKDGEEPKMQTITICSLTPGKIEQALTDIVVLENESCQFKVVGKNTLSLSGYYIDQGSDLPPDGYNSDDSEDEHDLRYVSSDVEMGPEDLDDVESDASRFEEVPEGENTLKRPRESMTNDAKPLSKAEKKKNKKQKLQDGSAAASGGEAKSTKSESTDQKKSKKETTVKELPSGLKIAEAKIGSGPVAKKGQTIGMRYIGKLANGKLFDSNTKGKPFTFRLAAGEVIKGWDEGIAGMQVGGERILTVPPALGYGKRGSPPDIPGNATLTFEVKCLSIK